MGTGSFHLCVSPQKFSFHAKYVIDSNLFRLESPNLTRAMRATSQNNVGGKCHGGEYPVGGSNRGGNVREGIIHGGKRRGELPGG